MTTGLAARAARPLFRRDANNIVKCKIDKSVAAVVLLIVMKSTHQSSSRILDSQSEIFLSMVPYTGTFARVPGSLSMVPTVPVRVGTYTLTYGTGTVL